MNRFYKYICFFSSIFLLHIISFSQSIYNGGSGDGFTIGCYAQANNIAFDIYAGGISDGYAIDCYAQADNIAFDIYAGGNSDGFAIDCYAQTDNIAFDIYAGGNSDGFAIDCYAQADNIAFDIYAGGNGNGNAMFCVGTITEVPLPIELINFNALLVNKKVHLNWQTASEINNDYFTIEKSKNVTDWEELGKINGAGNSSQVLNYNTIDYNPYLNISYYRLKQTDFDGQFSYSNIEAVNIEEGESSILIYPNPTDGMITIKGNENELSELIIYNVLGQNITSSVLVITISTKNKIVNFENLSKGIYLIKTKTTANTVYIK